MRRVRAEGDKIVTIGRARATRYGLRRRIRNLEPDLPVLRIDAGGKPHQAGRLTPLSADETVWLPASVVFGGLPPEVEDMQPSGYMGRAFPGQHADLSLPPRLTDWSNEHILMALARRGEDVSGNLVLGEESVERWFASRPVSVNRDDYPRLASAATAGEPAGSSAGGEMPKFGAFVDRRFAIVKFAVRGSAAGERWQDLLRLESLALGVLRETGVQAAEASIVESTTHTFLEVIRFDRIGERGRRALVSLAAVHGDPSVSWSRAAKGLDERGSITADDARRLTLYDAFAQLIANTDRHHHNVALFPEHDNPASAFAKRYRLAPAFDQLPMLYAPTSDGQLIAREFVLPTPRAETWEVWDGAGRLALAFWQRASELGDISTEMKGIASRNLDALARTLSLSK